MIDAVRRKARQLAAATLIAAMPLAAVTLTGANAQVPAIPAMPTLGEAYPLTPELVAAWVQSYPEVYAASQQLADRYDVPDADTPAAALAAYAMVTGAMAELNAIVGQYGFDDYGQWVSVMLSVVTAYALVSEDIPANMMAMMMTQFGQTQENIDAVTANLEAVAAVVQNLE